MKFVNISPCKFCHIVIAGDGPVGFYPMSGGPETQLLILADRGRLVQEKSQNFPLAGEMKKHEVLELKVRGREYRTYHAPIMHKAQWQKFKFSSYLNCIFA